MSGRLLERLLAPRALRAVFQPVIDCSVTPGVPHYHEGLVRGPVGTNLQYPDVLFSYARRKRAELELDRASARSVLEAARALPGASIGVNVHAQTLGADLGFPAFLEGLLREQGLAPEALVLEIVEHGLPGEFAAFRANREAMRELGVRVALDDFGTGQANHRMLLECRPDYVKLDAHFVQGSARDPARRVVLRSTAQLALHLGAIPVAEGVEAEDDLGTVLATGITMVQGFLLARPRPADEGETGEEAAVA